MSASQKYLQGKLAIVTGAGKANGIGFATAQALAEQGSDVVIHYNSNKDAALKNVEALKQLGVKAVAVQADAASASFGTDIVDATLKAFPGKTIDIVVNNAGILHGHESLRDFTAEEFDMVFHINLRAVWLLIKAAEPHLRSPGARVVSISTVAARLGAGGANFYTGSKAAVEVMSRGWAEELGPKGITVNVVSPGPIETDLVLPDDHPLVHKFRVNQYIKRNGTAREVADAILFLSSPSSSFVTGQVLNVDGGLLYP